MHGVKREGHRSNELIDKANHLLSSSTAFVRHYGDVVVYVKDLGRIVRLDQNHTLTLPNVLDDLAELNQLIKVVKLYLRGSRCKRLFKVELVLGLELSVGTCSIIITWLADVVEQVHFDDFLLVFLGPLSFLFASVSLKSLYLF